MAQALAVRISLLRRVLLWISQTVESAEGAASCGSEVRFQLHRHLSV